MRYRTRVTVYATTEDRSPTGVVHEVRTPLLENAPAIIIPAQAETRGAEMTVALDTYDVLIAGRHPDITTRMAIADRDGRQFSIEAVDVLLSERQTRVRARLVAAPVAIEGS